MRIFIASILLIIAYHSFAQTGPNKYWVKLTDKDNNQYSLDSPELFLSQRALVRRQTQGISITNTDLPVTQLYIDSLKSLGLTIHNISKWFNAVTVETTDTDLLDTISNLGFVQGSEKVCTFKCRLENNFTPAIVDHSKSLSVNTYNYGVAANQIEMFNGQLVHNAGYTGEGVHIAVIDAGFLYSDVHPGLDSLMNSGRLLGTKDFVDGDNNVFDHHQHGHNVLSTMAALDNGGMVGTAPHASYWLLRSEDTGAEYRVEEDNWISAAEFADSAGVDIINTSLGYNTFYDATQNYTYEDLDGNTARMSIAVDLASAKGILVTVSAGNEGSLSWHYINVPADADSALTVGAVNEQAEYASLSSTGPTFDGRIKPNVAAQGKNTYLASGASGYVTGSGTSFSSPLVAGMAACLWQSNRGLTNMQLLHVIEQSSSQYNAPDSLLGYGIPDFYYALLLIEAGKDEKPLKNDLFTVYPNPFSDEMNIDLFPSDSQTVVLEVIGANGQLLYNSEFFVMAGVRNHIVLDSRDIGDFSFYCIVRIITDKKVYKEKVIRAK